MAEWQRATVQKKETYSRGELDAWDAIVAARREKLQPSCTLDGERALALQKKGRFEQLSADGQTVTIFWIPKPNGRLRLTYISADFDDEEILGDVVAKAVIESLNDKAVTSVYWYTDDALGKTGDGRILSALAKRIDSISPDTFKVSWTGDAQNVIWEISR